MATIDVESLSLGPERGLSEGARAAAGACRFCQDPIHPRARICKSCGSPQGLFGQGTRVVGTFLSGVVAIGSLGIAYVEHYGAATAREAEAAQLVASDAAVTEIIEALDERGRAQLSGELSGRIEGSVETLNRRVQEQPTDVEARRELLLRKAVTPSTVAP